MVSSVYGIIGYPLSHSFSSAYFNRKFRENGLEAVFHAYPLASVQELPELLHQEPGLKGLSVTIPYKKAVMPLLNRVDAAASAIGAVNCIRVTNGFTEGFNTDVTGFSQSLAPLLRTHHHQALVLGTGGAAEAVTWVLSSLNIAFKSVSREKKGGSLTYEEVTPLLLSDYTLIINTTPLGMHPHTDGLPDIPYQALGAEHLLYDLVYNPAETRFLAAGRARGAATKNGLEMLELQAEAAWKIWNEDRQY